jgi:hypothetical protein
MRKWHTSSRGTLEAEAAFCFFALSGSLPAFRQFVNRALDSFGEVMPGVDYALQIWRKIRCLARCRIGKMLFCQRLGGTFESLQA